MLEEISFSNFFNAVRRLLTQRRSLVDMLGQSNLVLTVKELIASIMVVNDNFLFHSWRKKGIQLKLNPPHTSHIDLFAFRVTLLTICFLMPKSYALLMSYWWFWEQRWLPLARLPYDPKESYSLSPTTLLIFKTIVTVDSFNPKEFSLKDLRKNQRCCIQYFSNWFWKRK